MTALMAQHSLSAHDLAAGSVEVTGDKAVVILTGSICSADATAPGTAGPRCLTNTDQNSTNPGFKVTLEQLSDGKWYVYFPAKSS
ncbi:hypothetical protein [Streptomyces tateyamensis]|nr:hypothetical protein [Streptomyces tateyamensis]